MSVRKILFHIIGLIPAYLLNKTKKISRWPLLKAIVPELTKKMNGKGRIRKGVGEGLFFDAKGYRFTYLLGTYCIEEQSFLADNISNEDVFYDIGAHVGFYAVIGAQLVGEKGKVFAFEPVPEMAEKCRYNLQQNGFENAKVVRVAAGRKEGTRRFRVDEMKQASKLSKDGNMTVKVVQIDEWRKKNSAPLPDIILIDAEGNEINVLEGAMETIETKKPIILVEVHGVGDEFSKFVESRLEPIGYTVNTLGGADIPASPKTYYRAVARHKTHLN